MHVLDTAKSIGGALLKRLATGAAWIDLSALTALFFLVRRAGSGIDLAFDGVIYHLPYAARVVGLCPRDCYDMGSWFESYYPSFPLVAETGQGLLWLAFGTPAAASFLNLCAILIFCAYVWRCFSVSPALTFLALLATPLIQIHAVSLYVDVFSNLALTVALLSAFDLVSRPASFTWEKAAYFALGCILAGNAKMQMWPALAVMLAIVFCWIAVTKARAIGPAILSRRVRAIGCAALILLGACAFATAIRNVVEFGNPAYPVKLALGELHLPGLYEAQTADKIGSAWIEASPSVRFAASVFEFGGYSPREGNWTIDGGGAGTRQELVNWRMGGFFGAYVLAVLVLLGAGLSRRPVHEGISVIAAFGLITVVTAFAPQSFELRYYIYWMSLALSLALVFSAGNRSDTGEAGTLLRRIASAMVVAFFLAVGSITQWMHFTTPLVPFADAVRASGAAAFVEAHVEEGEIVCIDQLNPSNTFYIPLFHNAARYSLRVGYSGPACDEFVQVGSR